MSKLPFLLLLNLTYSLIPTKTSTANRAMNRMDINMKNTAKTSEYGNSSGGQYGMVVGSHDGDVGVGPIKQLSMLPLLKHIPQRLSPVA